MPFLIDAPCFLAHDNVAVLRPSSSGLWHLVVRWTDTNLLKSAVSSFMIPLVIRLQGSIPSTTLAHNLHFLELMDSSGCNFVHLGRIFLLYLKSENFWTLLYWVNTIISRSLLKLKTVWDVCVNREESIEIVRNKIFLEFSRLRIGSNDGPCDNDC